MNVIKPLIDTQPQPVAVDYNRPAPRISLAEERAQFAEALFQSQLEDGAARAFHEAQARTDGATIQSIKSILNGVGEGGNMTTIRQGAGMKEIADIRDWFGKRNAGDVLPFKKSAPPPQRPRPPAQQPLRPAARYSTDLGDLLKALVR